MSALLPRDATIGDLWHVLLDCFPSKMVGVEIVRIPASEIGEVGQVVKAYITAWLSGRGTTPYDAWLDLKSQLRQAPPLWERVQTVEGMAFLHDYDD